jgi:hypothetical protein
MSNMSRVGRWGCFLSLLLGVATLTGAQTTRLVAPQPIADAIAIAQQGAAQKSDDKQAKPSKPPAPAAVAQGVAQQPDHGNSGGFDFSVDLLGAKAPGTTFAEAMQADMQAKAQFMEQQQKLLTARYELTPRFRTRETMSGGKRIVLGPTAKLTEGLTWATLGSLAPDEIRKRNAFPYPALPHPKQSTGGQVFPPIQLELFPRLVRFDIDFDLPEAFLPDFPPPMYLNNRPELGDVSQGEVISINNYYRLFKGILTPVQLEGLRLLVTPFPQEEFNPTDDRKTMEPSLGVTCLDCHVNGHTTGQFHLTPDVRPQERRHRLDTVSLRGVAFQQLHGSKRSLRSVEDFTEFENSTAYFQR